MQKVIHILSVAIFFMAGTSLISCKKQDGGSAAVKGYVYTISNDSINNNIVMYKEDANGQLSYGDMYPSGGRGTGAGLGSQGSLILDKTSMMMFAVNAKDNSISCFRVAANGSLKLGQTIASGGMTPISLTLFKSWLYVVNGGGNICGFTVSSTGALAMIPGSTQPLSKGDAGPAEIMFQPDGSHLVVTEKNTNKICTFKVGSTGVAESPVVNPAYAETPFGFVFAGNDQLIITNAYGGGPTQSVISSLFIGTSGITSISTAVPTLQTSACWVTLTKGQDYAYATNAVSNTISSLHIGGVKNSLELVDAAVAKTGNAPTDIVLSSDAGFIYNMNSMSHTISQYQVLPQGRLLSLGEVTGMPPGAVGLAVY